ncbi:hypothetical protein V8G54_031333, partial [Vigna mungo]
TVTDYFTQLRVLWDELENFRSDPVCVCGVKCLCQFSSILAQRKLEDQAMQFLRGLTDQYGGTTVFSSLYFSCRNKIKFYKRCYLSCFDLQFCGRPGHNESTCYQKHGFPNTSSDIKSSKGDSTRGKICSYCGKPGHIIDVCYKKHDYLPGHRLFNAKSSSAKSVSITENKAADKDMYAYEIPDIRFTPQQYQALLALIQQPSNIASASTSNLAHINQIGSVSSSIHTPHSSGSIQPTICTTHTFNTAPWILDSGATYHVSYSLQFFTSYHTIAPVTVDLPNGHQVTATHAGIVHFTSTFYLIDFFMFPHLLSILFLYLN